MTTIFKSNSKLYIPLFATIILFFAAPALNNVHYSPQPQFWAEMTTAWIIIAMFVYTTIGHKRISIPFSIIPLGLFALYLSLQDNFVNNISFIGLNYVASLEMIICIMVAISINTIKQEISLRLITTVICYAILTGAILQSLIGLIQFTGTTKYFHDIIFYDSAHPTTNIFGHFGQRNHYAHYLSWGTFALVYLYAREKIKPELFYSLVVWLCFSLTISASRSVFLYFALASFISVISLTFRYKNLEIKRLAFLILMTTMILILVQYALPIAQKLLSDNSQAASGLSRLQSSDGGGRRIIEWQKALIIFKDHPLFGIGWNGFARQSVLLHPQFPNAALNSGLFTNCHNLILQLLAETGIIGAFIVVSGITICIIRIIRNNFGSEQLILLCLIGTTITHSMDEYPLWYLYFLAGFVVFLSLDKPIITINTNIYKKSIILLPSIIIGILMIQSSFTFDKLVSYYDTPDEQKEFNAQGNYLRNLADNNTIWAYYGIYTLDNYIDVDTDETNNFMSINEQRKYTSRLEKYHPYPDTMLKLAMLDFSLGDTSSAESLIQLDTVAFPVYKASFKQTLSDPYYKTLKRLIK